MPTTYDGSFLQEDFEKAFEMQIKDLDENQLWFLTKFAKHVRGRCRSNAAFNNYMSRNFPHAQFKEIQKFMHDGTPYNGLQIIVNGENSNGNNQEDNL